MSRVRANCPNCGATIEFRWAQAVQASCEYCHSILVRHDLDLAKVGTGTVVPLTPSPLQLGTEGRWHGHGFTVIGRLVYRWAGGGWSEWHCRFDDDTSAWLSDAQAEYVLTRHVTPQEPLPGYEELHTGIVFNHDRVRYRITSVTRAAYVGTEGELPFEYHDVADVPFADARTTDGGFATIDYSESPPLLFVGDAVELRQLELRNLREFEGW